MKKEKQVPKYDLQKLRKSLNLTQKEAADSIGLSVRSWQRLESTAGLVDVTNFVNANAGEFVFPAHPFEHFKIKGSMFSLAEIKIHQ